MSEPETFAALCAVELEEDETACGQSWSTGHGSGSDGDD